MARRIVAVSEEALVRAVSADHKPLRKLTETRGCIGRHIIRDDHLIRHILRVLKNREQARIGVVNLIVNRNHNRYLRVLDLLKVNLSVLTVDLSDVEISIAQITSLRSRV